MGRPSKKSDAVIDEIIDRVSRGTPLAEVCRDDHLPALRTFYDWAEADEALSARFARAREEGEEYIAADCLTIADDSRNDWMERQAEAGDEKALQLNGEHIQRSKLRIETRLKLLAKWNPKKWGDRQTVNHEGKLGLEQLVAGASED